MFSWILVLVGCGAEPEPASPPPRAPHVILITLDTTRADALGAYGAAPETTPHLDRLAAEGVRFEWALSHVPSTLSSHASMLTGLDPHGHRVPRNGFPLDPVHETLAERLAAAGYDTRAVVAASVLDHSMGLDAGFARYDDDLSIDQKIRYEDRADAVTDRALVAADGRDTDRPLLLWVHYFDAHHPYEAPEAVAERFVDSEHEPAWLDVEDLDAGEAFRRGLAGPEDMAWLRSTYQAEVSWMDSQIGRLLAGLEQRALLEEAIIAVVGDHGEMFGEDRARPMGHSFDVDLPLIRVPLIIAGRGPHALTPRVVPQAVKVSDLAPTLLAQAGVSGLLGTGQDLGPLLRGEPLQPRPVFLEATRGKVTGDTIRWNNAAHERGMVKDDQLLVRGLQGTDHAYALDAAQTPLSLGTQRLAVLSKALDAWDARAPAYRPPSEDSPLRAALEALGYVDAEEP